MFILSSSHLRGPLSSERCVQKGVRRLSRRRYAIRSAKVGLARASYTTTVLPVDQDAGSESFGIPPPGHQQAVPDARSERKSKAALPRQVLWFPRAPTASSTASVV